MVHTLRSNPQSTPWKTISNGSTGNRRTIVSETPQQSVVNALLKLGFELTGVDENGSPILQAGPNVKTRVAVGECDHREKVINMLHLLGYETETDDN
jgi:hypothetical protein